MSPQQRLSHQLQAAIHQIHLLLLDINHHLAHLEHQETQSLPALSKDQALALIAEYPSNRLMLIRAVENWHGIQPPLEGDVP